VIRNVAVPATPPDERRVNSGVVAKQVMGWKWLYKIRRVKVIIWVQLCTILIMLLVVWIYSSVWPAISREGRGMVEGVIYNVESSSALIDGQIVEEGDIIYGVTVIGIHRDKVEFEKDGERWEQHVWERPKHGWGEPNQPQVHADTTN